MEAAFGGPHSQEITMNTTPTAPETTMTTAYIERQSDSPIAAEAITHWIYG